MIWKDERGESLLEVITAVALTAIVSLMFLQFMDGAVKVTETQRQQTEVLAESRNVREILIRAIQSAQEIRMENNGFAVDTGEEVFYYNKEQGSLCCGSSEQVLFDRIHELDLYRDEGMICFRILFSGLDGKFCQVTGGAYPRNLEEEVSLPEDRTYDMMER